MGCPVFPSLDDIYCLSLVAYDVTYDLSISPLQRIWSSRCSRERSRPSPTARKCCLICSCLTFAPAIIRSRRTSRCSFTRSTNTPHFICGPSWASSCRFILNSPCSAVTLKKRTEVIGPNGGCLGFLTLFALLSLTVQMYRLNEWLNEWATEWQLRDTKQKLSVVELDRCGGTNKSATGRFLLLLLWNQSKWNGTFWGDIYHQYLPTYLPVYKCVWSYIA